MKAKSTLLLLPIMVFLTSCSPNDATGGEQIDYEETKKMVVDILKTDDGKKAIEEVMSSDGMKEKLVMDQQVVTNTIEQTLTSEKATDFWKKTFSDAKFAQSVAKNMQTENQKLLKELMNDPEYRAMMIEVFKEPEIQKEMADALKSKEYREHLQKVITETVDNPLFKVKLQELLLKAATAETKAASEKEGGKQQSSGGGQEGGSGGT